MEVIMADEVKPPAPTRMSYVDIFQLLHSDDPNKTAKLVAEYEAVRLETKENGGASGDETQMTSDDRPYPRGRIPAGSGRQPKLKKSKLMQKITGRKNARPVPMPGMS
ncbi:hypothetical protein DYB35_002272 [Aphanomyces astaci]|uniref:Uncharacterized protein n=1 Tax=Aphanomyces astaci TaxID=112090 RepID=A0A3R6ZD94_APHAT|nr:hypothetical protein DYB35_002272 [Aphanomyces astaci]